MKARQRQKHKQKENKREREKERYRQTDRQREREGRERECVRETKSKETWNVREMAKRSGQGNVRVINIKRNAERRTGISKDRYSKRLTTKLRTRESLAARRISSGMGHQRRNDR